MRACTALLLSIFVIGSGSVASAAGKKAGAKDPFGDLFGAVDKASKPKASKSAGRAPKAKAPKVAKASAPKPLGTEVASAAPAPSVDANAVVLSDYAPDRHAWAGP